MTKMILVAAVDQNYALGNNNQLLCHLPADLKHFKAITMGKPIIMGRKTFASIGKPLPGRLNLVLSRQNPDVAGVTVVDSLEQALQATQGAPEVMIIGGAQVYEQALANANEIYLTQIHHQFSADVFFPRLDASDWGCQAAEFRPQDEKNIFDLTFFHYIRKTPIVNPPEFPSYNKKMR